jgi:hypothetical protein
MPDFVRGGTPLTPFGENNWLRSTKAIKSTSYTVARATVPPVTIDGVAGQRILQKGAVMAAITSGPDAGKIGPYQAAGTAEVTTLTVTGTPTGGTYTLTWNGQTTTNIPYNATAAQVQAALEALSNIEVGDVLAAGGPHPGTPITVTWYGSQTGDVAQMTANSAGLTGGTTPTVTPTTSTPGVAGAADGRQTAANIVGINNTWVPWQLMERDVEVSVVYDAAGVQAWCMELSAAGLWVTLTNATRDALRGTAGLQINFK